MGGNRHLTTTFAAFKQSSLGSHSRSSVSMIQKCQRLYGFLVIKTTLQP